MSAIHVYLPLPAAPPPWSRRQDTTLPRPPRSRRRGRTLTEADQPDEGPAGRGRGRGHGRSGRGRRGSPGFDGTGFGPGPGRRRAPRGNVRNAVLALLAEEPLHGYAVIGLLAERSGGLWRPSPGSVYPVLAQLQEEDLVTAEEADGRKVFALTDAGRAHVAEHADELREPWTAAESRHRDRAVTLFDAMRGLGGAVREVARGGTEAQVEAARAVLDGARRSIYRILAEPPTDRPQTDQPPTDQPPTDQPPTSDEPPASR
jgi:DNA-binding PadR family transcriptional regulator